MRRSRQLWDEARSNGGMSLVRAILYELQPIRFSSIDTNGIVTKLKLTMQWITIFVTQTLPTLARGIYHVLCNFQKHEWGILLGVILYCYAIRFIHHVLDAGPAVLMLTALVGIFTIGLGDATDDGVSAYSVFNRGFQRILGSIDVEALVAQHVGGVMGAGVVGVGGINDDIDRHDDDDDENRHGGGRRRGRRPPPQEAADAVARVQGNDEHNDGDDQGENDGQPDNNNNHNNNGRSRKSGKKARRRNLEQRRELQQQRQAAMAMGFAGDGGGQEEAMAMQRLLEEQVAANEARGGDGN